MNIITLYVLLLIVLVVMCLLYICALAIYRKGRNLAPLQAKKEQLQAEIETAQQTYTEQQEKNKALLNQKEVAEEIIANADRKRQWLEENRDTVSNLENKIANVKAELEKVKDQNAVEQDSYKESQLKRQENEAAALAAEENRKRSEERLASITKQLDDTQKEQRQAERDRDSWERKREQAKADYEKAYLNKETLDEEVLTLRENRAKINHEINDLNDKKSQLEEAQKLREHRYEIWVREAEADFQQLVSKLEVKKQKLNEAFIAFQAENAKLVAAEQSRCTEQMKALANALTRKREEVTRELERLQKLIDDKKKELAELDKKTDSASAVLDTLGVRIDDATAKKAEEERRKRWADLERPVCTVDLTKKQNSIVEAAWLENFKGNLSDCGIVFNERIINAFHTSLKVADASPMVVLAGISGTGKSLLPELYAHAMGMNFLPVAVQPRWDSPQDMFGFFNYMEQRYKATELSRLLWQFDIYNNDHARAQFANGLPMNLVLLDEMNLARVEYYFSDMLSKLEVRRTIDEQDDEKRRMAEIELDGGAMSENEHHKRLFVGPNTLFVGTMNEDESTQALSDKVMDRSNVMRFGRPKSLKTKPNLDDFRNRYQDCQMTLNIWRSKNWQHDPSLDNQKALQDIMSKVNTELEKIGRPFAHRVWQAMKAYVDNYPDLSSAGFQCAVADQFEMKILPKLNGIEKEDRKVQELLKCISDVIHSSVQDEELWEAFEDIRKNTDEAFFQWRGITR